MTSGVPIVAFNAFSAAYGLAAELAARHGRGAVLLDTSVQCGEPIAPLLDRLRNTISHSRHAIAPESGSYSSFSSFALATASVRCPTPSFP